MEIFGFRLVKKSVLTSMEQVLKDSEYRAETSSRMLAAYLEGYAQELQDARRQSENHLRNEVELLKREISVLEARLAPVSLKSTLTPGLYASRVRTSDDELEAIIIVQGQCQSKSEFKEKLQKLRANAVVWKIIDFKRLEGADDPKLVVKI